VAQKRKKTIDKITFPEKGVAVDTNDFFSSFKGNEGDLFRLRRKIEEGIQADNPVCICNYCGTPIKLIFSGEHSGIQYFKHVRNKIACIAKKHKNRPEGVVRARQFKGRQEGRQHKEMKEFIAEMLHKDHDAREVRVETIYRHPASPRHWRKPDVLVKFSDKNIVFEIQRSRTLVSTIVARENFYHETKIYILWILSSFSPKKEAQTPLEKDIYYTHDENVFVFDEEAKMMSKTKGELVLTCHYEKYFVENNEMKSRWEKKFVTLKDLVYDADFKVYLYNSEREKQDLLKSIG
jgi:hypothetical protein